MRPSFGHTLTVALATAVAILLATAAASYRDARQLVSATDLLTRAHEVLSARDRLVGHSMDAESGSRAYVLHGAAGYRAQYEKGSHLADASLDRLAALVAGDTALTISMRQLHAATERRIAELGHVVAVRDSAGSAAAASTLLVADARAARDGAGHIADALIVRQVVMQRLRRALHERNANAGYPYRLSFSVGAARFDPAAPPSIEELIATADSMLYEQKKHKRQGMPAGR